MSNRLISIAEFELRLGIKRTTFLKWQRTMANFPRRIAISRSCVKYAESEVDHFIVSIADRRAGS